ncbi:hypothetical protein [Leuconostoc mesenteroides]|uniref:hypothetical protein n=1 Tax=Leuconostoc mesenteroides TaxID=1245 RepID=UPI0030CB80AB
MEKNVDTYKIFEAIIDKEINCDSDKDIAKLLVEQLSLKVPRFIAMVTLLTYLKEESNIRYNNVLSLVYPKIDGETKKRLIEKLNK